MLMKSLVFVYLSISSIAFGAIDKPVDVNLSDIPKGRIIEGSFENSKIFSGTTRKYWVYVPQQYNPDKPACVYIGQDGFRPEFTNALDKMIFSGKVPIMVGVFIQPGVLKSTCKEASNRINRCFEYDSLGDSYARFLLDEILPYISKTYNLNLSTDGNNRCIGGSSSGGICAFNAAWERPDAFRRVYCISGSFVAFRGGNIFPVLVRKCEPKPLRVFMHVGTNDMVNNGGNWWLASQEIEMSLKYAGYDYQFRYSDGKHCDKYTDIFPEAMEWLWRGWPAPVKAGVGSPRIQDILIENVNWQIVGQNYSNITGITVNRRGEIFFCEPLANKIYRIGTDGRIYDFSSDAQHISGLSTDANGCLYGISEQTGNFIMFDANGCAQKIVTGLHGHAITTLRNGGFYVTAGPYDSVESKIWHVSPEGEKKIVDKGLRSATGVAVSPDGWLLYVADGRSHWVYSYQINSDGSLTNREPFYWLHVPDNADDSGADGVIVDQRGVLYAATRMGIQTSDWQGHNQCILPVPGGRVSVIALGGTDFDMLYAVCGDKIFVRKVKVHGSHVFLPPTIPAGVKL